MPPFYLIHNDAAPAHHDPGPFILAAAPPRSGRSTACIFWPCERYAGRAVAGAADAWGSLIYGRGSGHGPGWIGPATPMARPASSARARLESDIDLAGLDRAHEHKGDAHGLTQTYQDSSLLTRTA